MMNGSKYHFFENTSSKSSSKKPSGHSSKKSPSLSILKCVQNAPSEVCLI